MRRPKCGRFIRRWNDAGAVQNVTLKRLIFTVTPGRSGTAYLCKLLESVPDVGAHHEPDPNFAWVMRAAQTDPQVAVQFLQQRKLPSIDAAPQPVYAETSHLVCKGFIEPMIDLGLRPDFIILRRPPREVAWSMVIRQTIPARTDLGQKYALSPNDPGVMAFDKWRTATHYQLCYWYAIEIERRQRNYAVMVQDNGMSAVDITNRELNHWDNFAAMLTALKLPVTEKVQKSHGAISSQMHNRNAQTPNMPSWLEVEENGVWSSIDPAYLPLRDAIAERYARDSG